MLVCIGPTTAEAAREAGLEIDLVAEDATGEGIIQALVRISRRQWRTSTPAARARRSARARRARDAPADGALRDLVRETPLAPDDLVYPLFVVEGRGVRLPIESMPGVDQLSVGVLADEARALVSLGIEAVLLFGIPSRRTLTGARATPRTVLSSRRSAR